MGRLTNDRPTSHSRTFQMAVSLQLLARSTSYGPGMAYFATIDMFGRLETFCKGW